MFDLKIQKKFITPEILFFLANKIRQKKYDCNSQNLEFDLDIAHLIDIMQPRCSTSNDLIEYCSAKHFTLAQSTGVAVLCRFDLRKGFVKGNVIWKSKKSHLFELGLLDTPVMQYNWKKHVVYEEYMKKMFDRF